MLRQCVLPRPRESQSRGTEQRSLRRSRQLDWQHREPPARPRLRPRKNLPVSRQRKRTRNEPPNRLHSRPHNKLRSKPRNRQLSRPTLPNWPRNRRRPHLTRLSKLPGESRGSIVPRRRKRRLTRRRQARRRMFPFARKVTRRLAVPGLALMRERAVVAPHG